MDLCTTKEVKDRKKVFQVNVDKIVVCMIMTCRILVLGNQIFKHITNNPSIAQTEYLTCQILFYMKNVFQFYIRKQYSLYFITCIMPNKVLATVQQKRLSKH